MPTAAHVDVLPLLVGVIAHIGILDVAAVALERVEAAPLLSHVVQHKVGCAVPHAVVDWEHRRLDACRHDAVGAFLLKVAEIQAISRRHLAQRSCSADGAAAVRSFAGKGINQREFVDVNKVLAHENGHLGSMGQVAQLVDAYPSLGMGDGDTCQGH